MIINYFSRNFVPRADYELRGTIMNKMAIKIKEQHRNLMNSIFAIHPYKKGSTWYFDDEPRGLSAEPFVGEINAMIDYMLVREGLVPSEPFTALFGMNKFPGHSMKLVHQLEEDGGNWYRCDISGMVGWLCPVLLKFFPVAPKEIYVKAVK